MSVSVAYTSNGTGPKRTITLSWTSDADGTFEAGDSNLANIRGYIMRVAFIPDTTDIPTDQYDLTLEDANGLDVLNGQGSNLSNSANSQTVPGIVITDGTYTSLMPIFIDGTLKLKGTACGNAKSGIVIVYMD